MMKKTLGLSLAALMAASSAMGGMSVMADEVKEIAFTDTVNEYGWTVPAETISFSYYACDDDATSQDEEDERLANVKQIMADDFNVQIDKYIYANDSDERLNLMLASGDYPDVIVGCSTTMANAFISQGRAIELTPYLEKYGQDILAGYGDYINLMREEDGGLYRLCSDYGYTTDVMGRDFSIRWDWLQESGLEVPNSFESYYETVKQLVAEHPTNENGEQVYAFTAFTLQGAEFYTTPLLYLGFYNTSTGIYKLNDDGTITYWVDTEEGREVAHYINRFWQEGLIDPDYQTKDYDTSKAFMANERVAGNIGTWWHNYVGGYQMWMSTDENYTEDKRMQELTWEETDATPNLISNSFIRPYNIVITDHCENPEEVIAYINWCQSPLGLAFTTMGPAGEDMAWNFDEEGKIKIDERYWYGDPDNSEFLWDDFESNCGSWNYVVGTPGYTTEALKDDPAQGFADPVSAVNAWDLIPDYTKLDIDKLGIGTKQGVFNAQTSKAYLTDTTMWSTSFAADSDEAYINQDVKERLLTDWNLCIQAETDEECDALYDQLVEDLHSIGLDQLVEAQQAALSENVARLDGSYWE